MSTILVDADACPVKGEIYRVAKRYRLKVCMVSNRPLRTPPLPWIETVAVGDRFDAADDWIAKEVKKGDIVVTGDIPLAARCLQKGALVLGPKGRALNEDNIGEALASRELSAQLRELGIATRGPSPFQPRDRSRFLQRLDAMAQAIRGPS
ncbi:MAG: YaiI/YqxD family protein [Desulfobacterales bacterium]|nr:YaiI/YqxD family protein [Desulfobacterales bacterium]